MDGIESAHSVSMDDNEIARMRSIAQNEPLRGKEGVKGALECASCGATKWLAGSSQPSEDHQSNCGWEAARTALVDRGVPVFETCVECGWILDSNLPRGGHSTCCTAWLTELDTIRASFQPDTRVRVRRGKASETIGAKVGVMNNNGKLCSVNDDGRVFIVLDDNAGRQWTHRSALEVAS